VARAQEQIKEMAVLNIEPEAYGTTIETLQKIMDNLRAFSLDDNG